MKRIDLITRGIESITIEGGPTLEMVCNDRRGVESMLDVADEEFEVVVGL